MVNHTEIKITPRDKIYASGVYLQAIEVVIDDTKQWRWVSVGFNDDTYFDGETIDVYNYANSFQGLIKTTE
jgi:hypothetical protein